jgi:crotonobetainyl-CoA:carnitine CoA-transferase CaiB-like acyl-CoA transferase
MGALSGVTVLDLSFFAPGRWATLVFGDLGADVICVEMPRGVRQFSPATDSDTNGRWLMYQRNKRSITLNLKTESGKRVFRELAAKADVIIESYKPGTAAKLGVDYESVKQFNPGIVYCSVSGFGQTGPSRHLVGHEPNYQGLSGVLFQNRKEFGEPQMLPALVGDLAGGASNAVMSVLAALFHKAKTGEGQYIDVSIVAGIVQYMGVFPYASWEKDEYRMTSYASGLRVDFRPYRCKDGKYVAISPSEPWQWERFCTVVGREDLKDRTETPEKRRETAGALSDVFLSKTQAEWIAINDVENFAVTPVRETMEEVESDPQMIHRGVFQELAYEPMGSVKQVAMAFQMSATPTSMRFMPRFGEHTREVLDELGFSADDIQSFQDDGTCEQDRPA